MPHMNDRLLFYHIPKTGGRWVLGAMKMGGVLGVRRAPRIPGVHPLGLRRHHAAPEAVVDECKKNRFQFCFVRRPYEWYRSFWCYRVHTQHLDPAFPLDGLWDKDFESFLGNVLARYPGFLTQVYQCFVGSDNTRMNFVGRQENLADDLVKALALAGEPGINEKRLRRLKPMNVSAGNPLFGGRAVANPSTIAKIETAESWVLETFYPEAKA